MSLKEYEQNLDYQLQEATVLLLLRDGEVLLAMKKRGFGVGKWNGVGGKPNPGEDILSAAIREAQEEAMITPLNVREMGVMNFYFPHKKWGQRVHIFVANEWTGEPAETEEMRPQWFKFDDVPYSNMWWDDELWMPKVFSGIQVKGSFMFGENEEVLDYFMEEIVL